jgi:hypothetical protein
VVLTGQSITLVPGEWAITVTAYTGTGEPYTAVGRGSTTVTVLAGQTVTAGFTIVPITGEGGTGTLRYAVTLPAVDTASLSLTQLAGNTLVSGMPLNLKDRASGEVADLAPGYYLLRIGLTQGGKSAGKTEVVHIYRGLITHAIYTFGGTDFGTAVSGISLDRTSAGILVGGTVALTAVISPDNAVNKDITWSSSDSGVAVVSVAAGSGGVPVTVTGAGAGTAEITAVTEDGGKTTVCTVTVTAPSTEAFITGFSLGVSGESVSINNSTNTITVILPFGNDMSAGRTPVISLSPGATVNPPSGQSQVFSGDKTYTVTAEDGTTTKTYTVKVSGSLEGSITGVRLSLVTTGGVVVDGFEGKQTGPSTFYITGGTTGIPDSYTYRLSYRLPANASVVEGPQPGGIVTKSTTTITITKPGYEPYVFTVRIMIYQRVDGG